MRETLNRINELAKISKTRNLTQEETNERQGLINEYIKTFRGSMDSILLNTTIIDPLGNDVTPEKLKEVQAQNKVAISNEQTIGRIYSN
ncbi:MULTISPECIES: DUF896 domain-containing protein [Bacillaceae]|uniref:DUF896 domain-containing protein n=1 Tax=Bacillaceae TaxID=186817 RepID=UPI001E51D296|nr:MULTISPECIES: DUF896 domain-containing protein [Bacillaceae]MCE4051140.1 DUF896 domain-containing protein [Bacillus sp. Au-Bac7]MCM3030255.1 DUF896 domain-containing protein [Niallia sp. MER 6]MDL0436864.1 DUF896 domain-containing protein [Niallia sp. SS-2023]UPO88227.1 DUF896 domain-containing protein [Niallia sp. Man26]